MIQTVESKTFTRNTALDIISCCVFFILFRFNLHRQSSKIDNVTNFAKVPETKLPLLKAFPRAVIRMNAASAATGCLTCLCCEFMVRAEI